MTVSPWNVGSGISPKSAPSAAGREREELRHLGREGGLVGTEGVVAHLDVVHVDRADDRRDDGADGVQRDRQVEGDEPRDEGQRRPRVIGDDIDLIVRDDEHDAPGLSRNRGACHGRGRRLEHEGHRAPWAHGVVGVVAEEEGQHAGRDRHGRPADGHLGERLVEPPLEHERGHGAVHEAVGEAEAQVVGRSAARDGGSEHRWPGGGRNEGLGDRRRIRNGRQRDDVRVDDERHALRVLRDVRVDGVDVHIERLADRAADVDVGEGPVEGAGQLVLEGGLQLRLHVALEVKQEEVDEVTEEAALQLGRPTREDDVARVDAHLELTDQVHVGRDEDVRGVVIGLAPEVEAVDMEMEGVDRDLGRHRVDARAEDVRVLGAGREGGDRAVARRPPDEVPRGEGGLEHRLDDALDVAEPRVVQAVEIRVRHPEAERPRRAPEHDDGVLVHGAQRQRLDRRFDDVHRAGSEADGPREGTGPRVEGRERAIDEENVRLGQIAEDLPGDDHRRSSGDRARRGRGDGDARRERAQIEANGPGRRHRAERRARADEDRHEARRATGWTACSRTGSARRRTSSAAPPPRQSSRIPRAGRRGRARRRRRWRAARAV